MTGVVAHYCENTGLGGVVIFFWPFVIKLILSACFLAVLEISVCAYKPVYTVLP